MLRKPGLATRVILYGDVAHWYPLFGEPALQARKFRGQRAPEFAAGSRNLSRKLIANHRRPHIYAAKFSCADSEPEFRLSHALDQFCGVNNRSGIGQRAFALGLRMRDSGRLLFNLAGLLAAAILDHNGIPVLAIHRIGRNLNSGNRKGVGRLGRLRRSTARSWTVLR